MNNKIDFSKLIGRYFWAFLISALICVDKEWEGAFKVLIGCYFTGGVVGLIKEIVAIRSDK